MKTAYEIVKAATMHGARLINPGFSEEDFEREFDELAKDVVAKSSMRHELYPTFSAVHCAEIEGHMMFVDNELNAVKLQSDLIAMCFWHAGGRETFFIKPGLTAIIANMDVPEMNWEFVKMPFRSFYLIPGLKIFEMTGNDARIGEFRDQIIGFHYHENHEEGISIIAMAYPNSPKFGELCSWSEFVLTKEMLESGGKIDIEPVVDKMLGSEKLSTQDMKTSKEMFLQMLSFALNALLYLTSANPEISGKHQHGIDLENALARAGKKRRDKIKKAIEKTSFVPHRDLGRSIILDKDVVIDRQSFGKSGHKLLHRVHTKGHHKWQPYGPKSSLRKRIFVHEYFKGPDTADIVRKTYIVNAKDPQKLPAKLENPKT